MRRAYRGIMRRLGARRPDEGAALVVVVGSMLVLSLLAMTALAYTMSGQRFARYDQDYNAAMAAAQAGVEDFISRLNRDPTYANSVDCTNASWRGPISDTNACGWGESTEPGWSPVVPGDSGNDAAWFHTRVDNMTLNKNSGTVDLVVTGRVRDEVRTIQATVGKGGSTDYVYYTNYESADPSNRQAYPSGVKHAYCGSGDGTGARWWWKGRSDVSSSFGCQEITFGKNDKLDGAVFSNDAVHNSGGQFLVTFETADPRCATATSAVSTWGRCLRAGSTLTTETFAQQPRYSEARYLDDTADQFGTYPGCHYYGSTRVKLNDNGTMTVWNKKSVNGNTAPTAVISPEGVTPSCGTPDALDHVNGATVPVPDDMVLFVDKAPTTVPMRQCYAQELGGPSGRTLPLGSYSAAKASGPSGSGDSYTVDTNMRDTTKYCGEGNLYIEGVLSGSLTAASAQSIIVTGDLVMKNGVGTASPDMLGLVAQNSVEVFHPRVATVSAQKKGSGSCWSGCVYEWGSPGTASEATGWPTRYADPSVGKNNPTSGVQISASIQTLQHSFFVQTYKEGPQKGTLLVQGSIAQQWRGIVATEGSSGYTKDYRYDQRLLTRWPPYFPKWANAQYSMRVSGEINTDDVVRQSQP